MKAKRDNCKDFSSLVDGLIVTPAPVGAAVIAVTGGPTSVIDSIFSGTFSTVIVVKSTIVR